MKIRNGFVSNSSSSSFVIVMTPTQYNKWTSELNPYELQVVKELETSTQQLEEVDVITLAGITGNYGFYEYLELELIPEDENLSEDDLCEKYGCEFYAGEFWENAVGKLPQNSVFATVDF